MVRLPRLRARSASCRQRCRRSLCPPHLLLPCSATTSRSPRRSPRSRPTFSCGESPPTAAPIIPSLHLSSRERNTAPSALTHRHPPALQARPRDVRARAHLRAQRPRGLSHRRGGPADELQHRLLRQRRLHLPGLRPHQGARARIRTRALLSASEGPGAAPLAASFALALRSGTRDGALSCLRRHSVLRPSSACLPARR